MKRVSDRAVDLFFTDEGIITVENEFGRSFNTLEFRFLAFLLQRLVGMRSIQSELQVVVIFLVSFGLTACGEFRASQGMGNTTASSQSSSSQEILSVVQTKVTSTISNAGTSVSSLQNALQSLSSMLQEIQNLDVSNQPASTQQLKLQLIQQIDSATVQLQTSLQVAQGAPNPTPSPSPTPINPPASGSCQIGAQQISSGQAEYIFSSTSPSSGSCSPLLLDIICSEGQLEYPISGVVLSPSSTLSPYCTDQVSGSTSSETYASLVEQDVSNLDVFASALGIGVPTNSSQYHFNVQLLGTVSASDSNHAAITTGNLPANSDVRFPASHKVSGTGTGPAIEGNCNGCTIDVSALVLTGSVTAPVGSLLYVTGANFPIDVDGVSVGLSPSTYLDVSKTGGNGQFTFSFSAPTQSATVTVTSSAGFTVTNAPVPASLANGATLTTTVTCTAASQTETVGMISVRINQVVLEVTLYCSNNPVPGSGGGGGGIGLIF